MDKEIIIYNGDEHRAKMEKQFSINDIFADVYSKAYKLLKEIEKEMEAYRGEIEKNKNRLARYQGLGNNMIIFCGGRGQGKTSVMQSFAKCLDGTYWDEKADKDTKRLGFVSEISDRKMYEVVDSIDPSAMESDESILKVLISRLFFRLEEYIKSDKCFQKDNKDFLQNKRDIVKLFEKCYANIGCIKSGKAVNCEQDDLQTLSQMGSSAKLKENLNDLIEKYLLMMAGGKKSGDENFRYLVIPIDDADLATKKLFRLCEDIRNYLSIPNVIILMAVDYEQLVHAIYQRYLKQYKVMREADALSGHKSYAEDRCHKMAAQYLEKVFPTIHRIDLPQIDNILMEGYENVRFDYKIMVKHGEYVSVFEEEELKRCKNVQEQLLKILYLRTGMIFSNQDQNMHPFMPHTLRELTHWVKMLYDMNKIDCDVDIYQKFQKAEWITDELADGISWLKENVMVIKQYFMSYWCEKYLDVSQVRALRDIDSATKQYRMTDVANTLYNYLGGNAADCRGTYRAVMRDIVEDKCEGKGYFQEAIYIYYTIFLNEWFAVALKDNKQFEKIVQFVERTVDLSKYDKNKYKGIYNIMRFPVDANIIRTIFRTINASVDVCLKNFCVVVRNGSLRESISISQVVEQSIQLNPEIETLEFDILRPVIAQLKESSNRTGVKEEKDTLIDDNEKKQESEYRKMPYLITVRNIIANYDMQIQLQKVVDSWYEANNAQRKLVSPGEQIPKLYEAVQAGMPKYQNVPDHSISDICENANVKDKEFINFMFLCNKENIQNYTDRINTCLKECWNKVEGTTKKIRSERLEDDLGKLVTRQKQVTSVLQEIETKLSEIWIDWGKFMAVGSLSKLDFPGKVKMATDTYGKILSMQGQMEKMLIEIQGRIDSIEKGEMDVLEPQQEPSAKDRPEE